MAMPCGGTPVFHVATPLEYLTTLPSACIFSNHGELPAGPLAFQYCSLVCTLMSARIRRLVLCCLHPAGEQRQDHVRHRCPAHRRGPGGASQKLRLRADSRHESAAVLTGLVPARGLAAKRRQHRHASATSSHGKRERVEAGGAGGKVEPRKGWRFTAVLRFLERRAECPPPRHPPRIASSPAHPRFVLAGMSARRRRRARPRGRPASAH